MILTVFQPFFLHVDHTRRGGANAPRISIDITDNVYNIIIVTRGVRRFVFQGMPTTLLGPILTKLVDVFNKLYV